MKNKFLITSALIITILLNTIKIMPSPLSSIPTEKKLPDPWFYWFNNLTPKEKITYCLNILNLIKNTREEILKDFSARLQSCTPSTRTTIESTINKHYNLSSNSNL